MSSDRIITLAVYTGNIFPGLENIFPMFSTVLYTSIWKYTEPNLTDPTTPSSRSGDVPAVPSLSILTPVLLIPI